jgi:AcrR family transcriptional regulator
MNLLQDLLTATVCRETSIVTLTTTEQAREVLAALGLNKSELADVLRVSRPAVYDWFDGKDPNPANAERLASLLQLLARANVTSAAPLDARFVRQPLEERSRSLLDELSEEQADDQRVERLLHDARVLSENLQQRRQSREDRLRSLGYDEPSDEQRREQLNRNVAMLDWPKR